MAQFCELDIDADAVTTTRIKQLTEKDCMNLLRGTEGFEWQYTYYKSQHLMVCLQFNSSVFGYMNLHRTHNNIVC